ncbi:MAG: heavy metal translocating P-type ATPase, partial [Campylobacterales bacterium]
MKRKCDHCHLEFDEKVLTKEQIDGEDRYFCCNGCQGVYHLLNSKGLDDFYEKLGNNTLEPPKEALEDSSKFDAEVFKQRYIKEKDGLFEISLIIEGIHCAACVWLNEKILNESEGIVDASLNYTTHKAKILWNPKKINLSEIIEKIRAIGYNAYAYDPAMQERGANLVRREYYTRMVVGLFCTMNIMWIAVAQYAGFFMGMHKDIKTILNVAEWILATPALFYSGWIFFKSAYFGLKNRMINMDLLVIGGALLTYLYSIYATITMHGETYFESATMIVTFVLVGKFLEVRSKKSAVDVLDRLNSQIPTEAMVLRDGEQMVLPVEQVEVGDVLELKAGERVAVEGKLLSAEASFDESMITGESLPVLKQRGDEVISGSINIEGSAKVEALKTFSDSLLSNIYSLVEDSLDKKPKIQERANSISKHFSAVVLSIAGLSFLGWWLFGGDIQHAFIISVAVIIIACPCALALATPVATLIGIGEALKKGILFKEARFLETMANADILVLDKTGTITEGKPVIKEHSEYKRADLSYIKAITKGSNHPISRAISNYLQDIEPKECDVKEIKGGGVEAVIDGVSVAGGSRSFLEKRGIKVEESEKGLSFFYALDGEYAGSFYLEDRIRDEAKKSLEAIKAMGLKTIMLTGDNSIEANRVAKSVGVDEVRSSLDPLQKAQIVEELSQTNTVVMAGDGINDTLALSHSSVAIAMGSGTDAALSVSDTVLLNDSMDSLKEAFVISKRTFYFIKQNLGISLLYNVITIPLAVAGLVIPMIAALAMSLSSIVVVLNSLR